MAIRPFVHYFDRATFKWVMAEASKRNINTASVVEIAVWHLAQVTANPDLLTDAGKEALRELGKRVAIPLPPLT